MDLRPNNEPVPLARLAAMIGGALVDATSATATLIRGVTVDSRRVLPGDLFVGLPGEKAHGANFCHQAAEQGAVAALTDADGLTAARASALPAIVVPDPRSQVGTVAAEVYGHPANRLLTFAVTGTNGKTTTTWLLEAGLRAAGHVTGLVGTVQTQIAGRPVPSVRTTPEAAELQALLAVMVESRVTAVAVEVSSHALQLGRVDGLVFDVAGFTQFGSDHLDFHTSLDEYFAAKARLFTPALADQGVVCVDDDGGRRIAASATIPVQTVTASTGAADWRAKDIVPLVAGGYDFSLTGPDGLTRPVGVRLPGRFNVANASLAFAMLAMAGVSDATRGIRECPGVPGRMETVSAGQDFVALVDYAHTPDALESVLTSMTLETQASRTGRLMVVFGCGGDRDSRKRPEMGAVAARLADLVVITDDNPRTEEPSRIRREVLVGTQLVPDATRAAIHEVADRAQAIAFAVDQAQSGDVLVVAGKGHESAQERASGVEPFDDREVLLDRLRHRALAPEQPAAPEEGQ